MRLYSWLPVLHLASIGAGGAEIKGSVVDVSGAPIPAARISIGTASATVASTVSDPSGRYVLVNVTPGRYVLRAEKPGFAEFRTAVQVREQGTGDVAVQLSVDPVRTQVTVSAEMSAAVETTAVAQPVTVITKEDLHARALVLSDAADGEAGVHQLRTGPTLGAFFVRGMTGKNVAMFRDGVRYTTSAQRGGISTFLNLLQAEGVDSIEILRGPNSAQYGSDSLGGTLSVTSRPVALEGPKAALHGSISPFFQSASNAFGSDAAMEYARGRWGMSAQLLGRRFHTMRTGRGIDSHAAVTRFLGVPSRVFGERLPETGFTSYGGVLRTQVRLGSRAHLIAHYERSQQDGGKRYDQLLGGDGNLIADLRNLMLDFGYLRWQQLRLGPFDQFSLTGSFNAQREERVNQGGQGNPLGAITHQYEKTKALGAQFLLDKHFRNVDWAWGGEGYRESIAAPSFSLNPATNAVSLVRPRIPDGARYWMHGLFTQAAWQPFHTSRVRLTGALRFGGVSYKSRASNSPLVGGRPLWPDDSLSATAVTGRAGSMYWIREWLGVHAHFSRGFRAPNVTDLGTVGLQGNGVYEAAYADLAGKNATIGDRADDQAQPTGLPVERLRPEFTNNFDFGFRIRNSRFQTELSGFRMVLDNSIISQTLLLPAGAVGQAIGEQTITRQLPSGAVFVATSTSPVLVRSNFAGARMHGVEHSLRARLSSRISFRENVTYVYSEDAKTGLPPDIEPGIPPLTFHPSLTFRPQGNRYWLEAYSLVANRQERLSSLALADRRIGNPRSRANIQAFFNNGARVRGLVANGVLLPTGETLEQVQNRVLGTANSAPQFTAIPGYAVFGARGGYSFGETSDVFVDVSNIGDRNYRGIGWGIDGPGRSITVKLRHRW